MLRRCDRNQRVFPALHVVQTSRLASNSSSMAGRSTRTPQRFHCAACGIEFATREQLEEHRRRAHQC